MGKMIKIGRVRHSNGATIGMEMSKGSISNESAAAIAAMFQSPSARDEPFLLLAQGSPVVRGELQAAIQREIDSKRYEQFGNDCLNALKKWTLTK